MEKHTRILRFFGLPRQTVEERLRDLLADPAVTADLTARDEDVTLLLAASDKSALEETVAQVSARMNVYLYSRDGKELAARVVELLQQHDMTLAAAESCTGGLLASALTDVPGCSKVFGTGVVSYSCDCKEKLLHVKKETLKAHGAVSRETAGEMARGVRAAAGARLGISITGEAGPQPAEDHPVGTVYVALADGKRTWVQKLQLGDGIRDRAAIRRAAAAHAMDLVRRYLEAYPAVMAGGVTTVSQPARKPGARVWLPNLFPRRQDGIKKRLFKIAMWLLIFLLVAGIAMGGYELAQAPSANRQLQDSLRGLYWNEGGSLSNLTQTTGEYPEGMLPRFRSLYDINPDVGGWIRIPDTVIDYPVMTYGDGYYSNHSFAGEYSYYGQPYFSVDTLQRDTQPKTLFIYGNNTRDEQMFSTLLSYRRIAYLQENPVVEMNTLYSTAKWQIFAVVAVDTDDDTFDYTTVTDRKAYLRQLRDRSLFNCDLPVSGKERLLLLSTDAEKEYGHSGARLVIAAVEITDTAPAVTYTANWDARMPSSWTTVANRTTHTTAGKASAGDTVSDTDKEPADTTTAETTTTTPPATTTTTQTADTTTTTSVQETSTTTSAEEPDTGNPIVPDEETETENDADLGN